MTGARFSVIGWLELSESVIAMSLASLAIGFGGRIDSGAVRVPAAQLVQLLVVAETNGQKVALFECLFLTEGGTRPSLELSRQCRDFGSFELFVAFAKEAVAQALDEARAEGAEAVFEVW